MSASDGQCASYLLSVIFLKIVTFSPYNSYFFMWLNMCPFKNETNASGEVEWMSPIQC